MLSNTSRWLTNLTGTLYAILGFLLFFLPEQFAPVFARKVTPFMTMAIGALPLIWERNLSVLLNHVDASYVLVIFITAAIFVYLRIFDFGIKPGQLIYVGAYFLVGVPTLLVLLSEGTGLRKA
jgi:hypothetical protein